MHRSFSISWLALAIVFTVAAAGASAGRVSLARAEDGKKPALPYDARRDRLEGFDKAELTRLEPYLSRGPVALVEFADMDADQLPAIDVALHVPAPASVVEALVTEPSGYPRFMPALDKVSVVERHDHVIVYDWSFDLAILRMHGRNVMTIYPKNLARPDAGSRVTIDSEEGDLGRGRYLLRVVPRGERDCTLVIALRLDLREANYVARQLAKAARSVNRSANLSLALSMALHFREEAERKAGVKTTTREPTALVRPDFDLRALGPLLGRGDLVMVENSGARLDQLSVLGAVEQKSERVHEAVRDAQSFGSALVPGGAAKVVSHEGAVTTFDWDIDLPLVGVSGQMRMNDEPKRVSIDATEGALRGGQWRFELTPLGKSMTLVTGWARFDLSDSSWLLEKLVKADPFLGHGMGAASEIMLVRALRSRAAQPQ